MNQALLSAHYTVLTLNFQLRTAHIRPSSVITSDALIPAFVVMVMIHVEITLVVEESCRPLALRESLWAAWWDLPFF